MTIIPGVIKRYANFSAVCWVRISLLATVYFLFVFCGHTSAFFSTMETVEKAHSFLLTRGRVNVERNGY